MELRSTLKIKKPVEDSTAASLAAPQTPGYSPAPPLPGQRLLHVHPASPHRSLSRPKRRLCRPPRGGRRWTPRPPPPRQPGPAGVTTRVCHAAALLRLQKAELGVCMHKYRKTTPATGIHSSHGKIRRFLEVEMFHSSQDPEKDFFLHVFCAVFA